ncbi:MAG: VWA domain-containing protein [Spirochaetaceae bacterium]|jgi:Ca-activated chloride channel family protein|nr:VWA domain-containing protein [Spirochaetaceae bacterium]
MPNFAFERPVFALAALLSPFAFVIAGRFFRRAFSLSLSLGPPGGAIFKAPLSAGFLGQFCKIITFFGAALLLLAASGPIAVSPAVVWLDRGADILFVIDCSPSMAALDIAGRRRFDVSLDLVRDFSRNRPADAIGLVAVGNDAALLVPPTTDRAALESKLSSFYIGEMGDGTALGMGISVAALHLSGSVSPRRTIVLITDGENNAGAIHPETAAETLPARNISLYIIAVGSSGEVPVDYVDPVTRIRRTGMFESRYNPEALAKVASAGNGVFMPAPSAEAFTGAFSRVNEAEITVSRSGVRERKRPLHVPMIIAGAFMCAAAFLTRKMVLGAFL